MVVPQRPNDEAARLASLRSLGILDTEAEERFDRITRLTARLFGVPVAVISLVDENREWYKSCQGVPVKEGGRDVSFCGHAILSDEPFVIPDTLKDARFADNPQVTGEMQIRFYAGCVLHGPGGSRIGTLCIKDRRSRQLGPEEIGVLKDLAAMAEQEVNFLTVQQMQVALQHEKEQLERFNKVMLGREERIVELKEEIRALQARLPKPSA